MLYRCLWMIAASLIAAFSAFYLPSNCHAENSRQPIESYINVPFPPYLTEGSLRKASSVERPCKPGEDDRTSDLCAQWKAADAAQESAEWTKLTAQVAIGGLAVGALTLFAAIAAANYARRAADATEIAAHETKRIGEAQVRAYLVWDGMKMAFGKDINKKIWELLFIPYIQNAGQSPAIIVSMQSFIFIGKIDETAECSINLDESKVNHLIGGGGRFEFINQVVSLEDAIKSYRNEVRIDLIVFWEYRHIFQEKDEEPITEHNCFRILFKNDPIYFDDKTHLELNTYFLRNENYKIVVNKQ